MPEPSDPFPPRRVTAAHGCNDQLLYFTSTSLSADDRWLYFISDRTGAPNLFCREIGGADAGGDPGLASAAADRQLTFNDAGYLKSYVYFDGRVNAGFGRASVSLHAASGTLYYLQGLELRQVSGGRGGAARVEKTLARLPADQVTAFSHVSADGRFLCLPTTDARALEGYETQTYDIDGRVRAEGLNSYLRVFDTTTGAEVVCERVPRAWITHVQFNPADARQIVYNHEWPAECGIRRMWLFDGANGAHTRLRTVGAGRTAADWTCHEVFDRTGRYVYYHGTYHQGVSYVGRLDRSTGALVELGFPPEYKRYGHFTARGDGLLVSDGYYQDGTGAAVPRQGAWISLQRCDWEGGRLEWIPLCRHGSNWDSQDAHPHPIFSHAGDAVFFTSNKEGHRAVYRVAAGG